MLIFWKKLRAVTLVLAPCLAAMSTGCGFFPPLNSCSNTSGCTTSTDFMYVANTSNSAASPPSVAGFSLTTTTIAATGTTAATSTLSLATTPGSAYSLGYIPSAMTINPANSYLYVASLTGGIYLYVINSNGSITVQNNGTPVVSGFIASSLQVDTTGAYLIVSGASLSTTNAVVYVYSIASATGLLSAAGHLTVSKPGASNRLTIAANDVNVFLTLGTGGTEAFTFVSTTGALTDVGNLATLAATNADQSVATNPTGTFAFVTETGTAGVRVLTIGTNGGLTEVSGSPFAAGTGPTGILVDSSGSYVYVTNRTDNTISGFVLAANGTLTQITGSPFSTGTTPLDIAEDATGKYVGVVCNGGGQDLEVYSFDATTLGKLDAAANATTGTDPTLPIAIAATH
jgi:6-phosphogluconolactonase (cycloisomerase 2 family)